MQHTTDIYIADGYVALTAGYSALSLMAVPENEELPEGKLTTYGYDDLGRLISETMVDSSETDVINYTYDNRGNRATMTKNGTVTTYTYDMNNRLTAEQTGSNVKTFTYDANGNQLAAQYNLNYAGSYEYDLFGRQKRYTSDGLLYMEYSYRADGLRHSVDNTIHIWDGTDIVADVKSAGITIYARGNGLIYTDTAGVRTYYHQNGHGDVILLTDGIGTMVKSYGYDAFGWEWDAVATDNNPFRYCGEYDDKRTETVYLRARYYDSAYGRFTQQDGWQYTDANDHLSLNLYTCCWNNPTNMEDPDGHWSWFKFIRSTIKGAIDGYISARATGKNVFLSTMAGAVTGAISGLGEGLELPGVLGTVTEALFNGISSGIGSIFDQLLDGKSVDEIDYHDVLVSSIVGVIGSLAANFSEKMFDELVDLYNKLSEIFEGYTKAEPWVKDVLTYILY